MEFILNTFQNLSDPNWIMQNGGLYLVLVILFVETGIIFGFFLPGDPLLFISGMVLASATESHFPFSSNLLNLPFWMVLFSLATILGNYFGYWFGNRFKHIVHRDKDSLLIKRKHVASAHEFYEKKGGFAIAIARFLPIVRTFAPIIAGTTDMNLKKFSFYNILGAIIWVGSITTLGFVLGDIPWVKANLEIILIGIVVLVTAPVLIKLIFKKNKIA